MVKETKTDICSLRDTFAFCLHRWKNGIDKKLCQSGAPWLSLFASRVLRVSGMKHQRQSSMRSSPYLVSAVGEFELRAQSETQLPSGHLCMDYEALWNHWYDDNAEEVLHELGKRAREASELGVEMPYDQPLIDKWENKVYS